MAIAQIITSHSFELMKDWKVERVGAIIFEVGEVAFSISPHELLTKPNKITSILS